MEITPLTMYLFTRLGIIHEISIFFGIIILIIMVISSLPFIDLFTSKDIINYNIKQIKIAWFCGWFLGVSLTLIAIVVPTQKEMAAIYIVPKLANDEFIQELPGEIKELTKEWLQELKPDKVGEK